MYLKELTLRGFKSFASATTLRFQPGITAVVGPNGSGKSNIVDALTWVMGEQGAKNLRGTSMEDVIFAGTSSRPPLGRAQVSLTIDNSDRTLDIDYTEVTISRTIFRNGGSEYAINGSSCRLLDIQELLSDTGLGQQMHVIVGQGRLDAILKADPSGHRAFIEEAAGILKHRKRKERALRKLANTEANLSRLDDLLSEIHRQLGPLGRQARISRRADAIQVSLRDAQARLLAEDAVKAAARREGVRTELGQVRVELGEAQRELAQVKVRIEQVEALASGSSPAIDKVNQTWRALAQLQERFRSLASIADERARSLRGQMVTNMGEDPAILNQRADELEEQAASQVRMVDNMRLALDKATETRAGHEKQLASVRQTLTELRKTAAERDARIAKLRELVAREEAAVNLADTRAADFDAQRDSLRSQRDAAISQREALEREADAVGNDDGSALEEARATLAAKRETLNELLDRQRDLQSKVISLTAKADALNDTLESRNASGSLANDGAVGALGRLTDFLHVEEGWEEAIAHALDQFASALVVPDQTAMLTALNLAKTGKLGKAVVLTAASNTSVESVPVSGEDAAIDGDAVRASYGDTDALPPLRGGCQPKADWGRDEDKQPPVSDISASAVGQVSTRKTLSNSACMAATLITPSPSAPDAVQAASVVEAVRMLLGDTVAVETADEAQRLTSSGRTSHAVTKDGEVFAAGVAAVGGSSLSQSDLSLAARRDRALEQIKELSADAERLDAEVEAAKAARDEAGRVVDVESQKRTERKLKAEQAAKSLKSATDRVLGLERQLAALDGKAKAQAEEREIHVNKLEDLNRSLASAQEAGDGHVDSSELEERERNLETELGTARDHEVAAKIAWNEASRKAESLARQAALLRSNARQAAERRAHIEALNERRDKQATRIEAVGVDAREAAELVERAVADVVRRREALQAEASSHDEELKSLRAQRDRIEPKVNELTGREHALDVNRERLAAEYGQLMQKVSDELGMGLEELTAGYGPDQPVPVLDESGRPIPLEDSSTPALRASAQNDKSEKFSAQNDKEREQSFPTQNDKGDGLVSSARNDRNENASARNDEKTERSGSPVDSNGEGLASAILNGEAKPFPVILSGGGAGVEGSVNLAYKTVPYNRAEQQKRLDKAKRDLAALGKVNPLATEEYDALNERNAYLNDQRNDVAQSRDDLMKLIRDLDSTMVDVFSAAFEDTAAAFEKMFATLFPGGKGRLRLENPEDMLATGVIVEASPAGKRVKQLSLLSGGERSLTALALLFAIFTARPSPFYVMDEVEAALDDVNLTRLINAFNQLREHAQLIIITHQQRTMSIADALYGITMRSDGVTAVISQKLDKRP